MHFDLAEGVTHLSKDCCPQCGYTLDAATGAHGFEIPAPGDFSVCINCTSILEFSNDMSLQLLPIDKQQNLPKEEQEEIAKLQHFLRKRKHFHYH
jgi:hypothetical protein